MKAIRMTTIRSLLALLATVLCALGHAQPEPWPQRPVRILVPIAPGGSVDIVARLIAGRLTEELGQQFIVDNRSGAGGTIGTAIVARAEPDGHTILMMSGAFAASVPLYKLPYDPIRSFAPIAMLAVGPLFVTVHPSVKAANLPELIALARSKPGSLNYGSGGVGSSTHLVAEYFAQATGTSFTHVPYKGIGPAIADLLGGQIQLYIPPGPAVFPHVKEGRLRLLAQTYERRLATMPELPTVAETAPGFSAAFPYAMAAPAGTPKAIVSRMNASLGRILAQPEIVERLRTSGLEPAHSSPDELLKAIRRDIEKWTQVVAKGRIKID